MTSEYIHLKGSPRRIIRLIIEQVDVGNYIDLDLETAETIYPSLISNRDTTIGNSEICWAMRCGLTAARRDVDEEDMGDFGKELSKL